MSYFASFSIAAWLAVVVAAGVFRSRAYATFRGVTLGLFNHAERMRGFGFQLGLLNGIGDNPRWAQWLPLINFRF